MRVKDYMNTQGHMLLLSLQMAISQVMADTDKELQELTTPDTCKEHPERMFEETSVFLKESSGIIDRNKERVQALIVDYNEDIKDIVFNSEDVRNIFIQTAEVKVQSVIDKMEFDIKQSERRLELLKSLHEESLQETVMKGVDEAVSDSGDVPEEAFDTKLGETHNPA